MAGKRKNQKHSQISAGILKQHIGNLGWNGSRSRMGSFSQGREIRHMNWCDLAGAWRMDSVYKREPMIEAKRCIKCPLALIIANLLRWKRSMTGYPETGSGCKNFLKIHTVILSLRQALTGICSRPFWKTRGRKSVGDD